jgi:hypothetical protein
MAFDLEAHLLIVPVLGCCNECDSVHSLGEALRIAALAAANAPENEDY